MIIRPTISLVNPLNWIRKLRPLPVGRGLTIVTGMQKSGTTAIAKLLGAATGKSVCSDPFYNLYEKTKIDFRSEIYVDGLPLLEPPHRTIT